MMPGNLFCLELIGAFAARRRLVLRLGLSLLLALPFIFVGMPAQARAAGIVMVVLFTGLFGAAVGHARLCDDGRLERLTLLPGSRGTLWLDLVLAATLSRLAPTALVLIVFVIVNAQSITAGVLLTVFGLLGGSLLTVTLLGVATARLARSNAEVHLFAALAAGALALLSGLTPLPGRLAWLANATSWNPLGQLHTTLLALASGTPAVSAARWVVALLLLIALAVAAACRWVQGTGLFQRRV